MPLHLPPDSVVAVARHRLCAWSLSEPDTCKGCAKDKKLDERAFEGRHIPDWMLRLFFWPRRLQSLRLLSLAWLRLLQAGYCE